MSFSKKISIPGPCKPIELSIPLGVSAILGVALPLRGLIMIDFVTIAPSDVKGKNCESSLPDPAQPEAVKIGVGKNFPAIEVEKLMLICPTLHRESLEKNSIRPYCHPLLAHLHMFASF